MRFLKLKRVWLGLFFLLIIGLLSSCAGTRTLLMTAPSKPKGALATPAIVANSIPDWERQKGSLQTTFEKEVYGVMPKTFDSTEVSSREITGHNFQANIAEVTLQTLTEVNYTAVLLTPKNVRGPVPVIMMENFCPNHSVIPIESLSKPQAIILTAAATV